MKNLSWLWLAACLFLLGGCASTRAVDRDLPVSAEMQQEVERLFAAEKESNALVYRLSVVGADECADAPLVYRSPFSLLFNNAGLPSNEMRTAIFRMEGLDGQALLQTHLPALRGFDGARVVEVNGEATGNPNKAVGAMLAALDKGRKLRLKLEDGRTLEADGQPACPSLVAGDFTGKTMNAEAMGIFELVPTAWARLAHTPDERAFLLARSIYFTGAEGRVKLRNALFAGAAISGVLNGLTLGTSQFVGDPKHGMMQLRRQANRRDADAFALRLMRRAGFDGRAALDFAQRSLDEGAAWPRECEELRFDRERLEALRALM